MNWPVRLLIYGVTMFLGIVIKTGRFSHEQEGRVPEIQAKSDSIGWRERPRKPIATSGPSLVRSLAPPEQTNESAPEKSASSYQGIVERNVFALQPVPSPSVQSVLMLPPKEDLFLTGMMSGFDSVGSALFMVTAPGQPPLYFTLAEGEQNDWLEVLSVDVVNGTVKVILKKPVMRIRNTGVEAILLVEPPKSR